MSGAGGKAKGAKNVVIVGATGMVGGLALLKALGDPRVARVTAFVRRSTGISHRKLREILHEDFLDWSGVGDALEGQDVALYCLGTYTGTVPDAELRRVSVDMPVAFARALHAKSPGGAFCFLSGQGADRGETSRIAFARYKGMAENALLATGFARVHVFRPGYIHPVTRRVEPNLLYAVMRAVHPIASLVYPNIGVDSDALAEAMLDVGLEGSGSHDGPILENRDIRGLISGGVHRTRGSLASWFFLLFGAMVVLLGAQLLLSFLVAGQWPSPLALLMGLALAAWGSKLIGLTRPWAVRFTHDEMILTRVGWSRRVPLDSIRRITRSPRVGDALLGHSLEALRFELLGAAPGRRHVVVAPVDDAAFVTELARRVPRLTISSGEARDARAKPRRRRRRRQADARGKSARALGILALRAWLLAQVVAFFMVVAYRPLGSPGPANLELPWSHVDDFVATADGSVVVSLDLANRLQLHDGEGRFLRSRAVGAGLSVASLAATRDGRVMVVLWRDDESGRIDILDQDLTLIEQVEIDRLRGAAILLDEQGAPRVIERGSGKAPARLLGPGDIVHPQHDPSHPGPFHSPDGSALRRGAVGLQVDRPDGSSRTIHPSSWLMFLSWPLLGMLSLTAMLTYGDLRRTNERPPEPTWRDFRRVFALLLSAFIWLILALLIHVQMIERGWNIAALCLPLQAVWAMVAVALTLRGVAWMEEEEEA